LEDYLPVERDLAASVVEVNFASRFAKDYNGEEVVDKSRKMVSHVHI
jgi:hypothetical protein